MNLRERFLGVCDFRPVNPPRWDCLGFWYATVDRWLAEGLPPDRPIWDYFGMERREMLPINSGFVSCGYYPGFEKEVISEDEDRITYRDGDGIIKRERKDRPEMSMPQFLKFPVSNRSDWEGLKWRLDPSNPERYPNWAELCAGYRDRDYPLGMTICGGYGLPRNLFGEEHLAYMYYDDPNLIHEIMEHWLWFYKGMFDRICPDVDLDYIYIWEDMAFKNGPLIGPNLFEEFISPYYRALITHIRSHGVPHILVDSDGDNRLLLDLFLEAGVDMFFPFEIASGMEPVEAREKYGRRLVIWGGIDKRVLARDRAAIEHELIRKVPRLMEEGGFIPAVDHLIPPDVPLDNYRFFIDRLREMVER